MLKKEGDGTLPALFATTNTVLMMLVSGSRIVFGMAKDSSIPIFSQ
jgi:amino acid transporter